MAKTANKHNPIMRVVITLIGVVLILMAANNIGLLIFGKKAPALDIQATPYNLNPDYNRDVEQQYKWTVTWTFSADGKVYEGRATTGGTSYNVKTYNTIYYYPFAPQINSMYAKDAVSWGTLFYFLIGGFLIVIINIKPKKDKRVKGKTERQAAVETNTYDDSVEELFHEGGQAPTAQTNEGNREAPPQSPSPSFCPGCGTKLESGVRFCPNCGARTGN